MGQGNSNRFVRQKQRMEGKVPLVGYSESFKEVVSLVQNISLYILLTTLPLSHRQLYFLEKN